MAREGWQGQQDSNPRPSVGRGSNRESHINQCAVHTFRAEHPENETRKVGTSKTIRDWSRHARPGDVLNAIFAPIEQTRAHYGSPLAFEDLAFLERLLAGGDVAVVQSFGRKLVILPEENLMAGGLA